VAVFFTLAFAFGFAENSYVEQVARCAAGTSALEGREAGKVYKF